MLFPDSKYESGSSTAQTWMLAHPVSVNYFQKLGFIHSLGSTTTTLVLVWDSVFVLRWDTVQELHRVAGGPEDQTLQDRGQRKPEEHPQLRLAQSLPEGQKSTQHHPLHANTQCAHKTCSGAVSSLSNACFLCAVPAGCQLPVRSPGEAGGFGLAVGPGC